MEKLDEPEQTDGDYPMVDVYVQTEEDHRAAFIGLLDAAGITIQELRDEGKADEFSSEYSEDAWFWFSHCLDEFE